ncbi:MAG: helix-turn-helix transcriptional regulator [Chloroflexi bacterium]|nr:helix-turn-helix transcriptional regulator [Chloroflexota bacterium]
MAERTAFAEWLDHELKTRGLSQAQLAAYLGRSQQTVSSWLVDGRLPRTDACQELARVLHVPLSEVYRRAGHPVEGEAAEPPIDPQLATDHDRKVIPIRRRA